LKWTNNHSSECPLCKKNISMMTYKNLAGDVVSLPIQEHRLDEDEY
jgi:hypothetical protein